MNREKGAGEEGRGGAKLEFFLNIYIKSSLGGNLVGEGGLGGGSMPTM